MASVHILRAMSSPAPSPLPLSFFFVPASYACALPPPLTLGISAMYPPILEDRKCRLFIFHFPAMPCRYSPF